MPITNKALPNLSPESGGTDLARYISVIWQVMVIIGGISVLLFLIWGALDWIFSGSNPERLKRAKDKMFDGIFGLAILILSFIIVKIISSITGLNILNPEWPTF